MNKISELQEELLTLLEDHIDDPISIQQMADILEIGSKSTIHHHLKQLEKKGYLRRNLSNPREYHTFREPNNSILFLPFYGLAKCGPHGNPLDGKIQEYLPISSKFVSCNHEAAFVLEAEGDSMEPDIHEGDYIIVDQSSTTTNGEKALCIILEGDTVTEVVVKTIFNRNDNIELVSSNSSKYPVRSVAKENINVIGAIRGIICTAQN